MLRATLALIALLTLGACRVPPRPADPSASGGPVNTPLFAAAELRVHRASVGGAIIPDRAFNAAMAALERHTGRPPRIYDHGDTDAGESSFPVFDRGRAVTEADVAALHPAPYLLAEPDRGILGAIGVPTADGRLRLLPIVEPGTILVLSTPGDDSAVTGYATTAAAPDLTMTRALVVLHRAPIERRSNWFVSREKLWRWTLTHELGHVLGVPASSDHTWDVPNLGPHCTRPECVLYTGVDWRVVLSGLLHGWPMDFCDACAGELAAARGGAAR